MSQSTDKQLALLFFEPNDVEDLVWIRQRLYILKRMAHVKENIQDTLAHKFFVFFERWLRENTHYVSLFATYPAQNSLIFHKHLLGLFQMAKKDFLDTAQHFDNVDYVLETHERFFTNVEAIVGEIVATNKAFARHV